jgi:predicted TIM-barrel fold metal-dependent hydrolase
VALGTSVLDRQLDDRALLPLYEALNDRAATVFLHPLMTYDGFGQNDYGMNRSVGAMFEDTIGVLRLLLSGICARNSRVKFVVPHLGGTLPFVYGRIRRHLERREEEWRGGTVPAPGDDAGRGLRRFWFDTAMRHAPALGCACETAGHDRLVFGTDYPYLTTAGELAARIRTIQDLPIPPSAQDAVLGGTAAAMLGVGPAPPQTENGRPP